MQQLTGIFDLTWLENIQDAFLSSAKFVGIDRQKTACQRESCHQLLINGRSCIRRYRNHIMIWFQMDYVAEFQTIWIAVTRTVKFVLHVKARTLKTGLHCVTVCRRFRGITTGSEFPSLYHSVRQISQCHHTDLCPAPVIVTCER